MPFDESLAVRIRAALGRKKGVAEKKMFGGLCFLLHGHMLVGVWKNALIARIGAEQADDALREPHVRPMDITGKPMKGWVLVDPEGVADAEAVKQWTQRALKFVGTLPPK